MFNILLYTGQQTNTSDLFLWALGLLLVAAAVAAIFWQRRVGRELKYELAQLEKVKKHNIEFEFVLKAMKLSTWHVNGQLRQINYDNDYREELDSYTPVPDMPLEDLGDMMAEKDRLRVMKAFDDICTGRTEEFHEIYQMKMPHSGKFYWAESYATIASRDAEGNPLNIVGTSMRIDERKNMENALVAARNKAEESDRLKSAFIANMSHEIRTPLNAIIGFTSVLPDVEDPVEHKNLINIIQENNQKLLRIIDDVMNISKIEAGRSELTLSAFDLNIVLRELVDAYQPKVKPGVVLSTMFGNSSQTVTTDLSRLQEVMNHLLSNAVKFTDAGSIIVGYEQTGDDRLRIWVRDTGKGISEENKDRVFERFFKVDEFIPGAGLGLSTCRTMAYSMGGEVGVESKLGEGSTFWLTIPISM